MRRAHITWIAWLAPFFATAQVDYSLIGDRINARIKDGIAITEGVIRVRRRHENDMDFSKYNPFYWEGRSTTFKVEDFTPRGEKKIVFSLFTEWPQSDTTYRGNDLSAIYIGDPLAHETERSKFAINARMRHVKEHRHFEWVLDENAFKAHPEHLQSGQLLTFEYRFFNDVEHPPWVKQKNRNPHNLFAYYSEFLRIRMGVPGLLIDDLDSPNAFPSPKRYAGGWTTIPTVRVEPWSALQQQAFNLTPANAQNFLLGRTWFHTDMLSGKHISDTSDDKPSLFFEDMEAARAKYAAELYNARSCNTCHVHNGDSLLPDPGQPIHTTIAKLSGAPHPLFGRQIQTDGEHLEGELKLNGLEEHDVTLDDGTVITLSKPVLSVSGQPNLRLSLRTPPAIIGMGLLEAVPEALLLRLAKKYGGEARMINGQIGRFGWKAEQPTLIGQIKTALLNDMGVRSEGFEQLDHGSDIQRGKALLGEKPIALIDAYVALLGVPPRVRPESTEVLAGEKIFHSLECQRCHFPNLITQDARYPELTNQRFQPYTDLLLHDMGDGLADSGDDPYARKWRTAPLWGLKNTRDAADHLREQFAPGDTHVSYADTQAAVKKNRLQLLHDGRASSLPEAILWHGGEARGSVQKYKALSKTDRQALEAFLWDL